MRVEYAVASLLYLFVSVFFFFFNDTATTEIYTLSLHDALPIYAPGRPVPQRSAGGADHRRPLRRSEEHTSELQSPDHLVCRLLLEKKYNHFSLSTRPPGLVHLGQAQPPRSQD